MHAQLGSWLVRPIPPPLTAGITVGALLVVLETLLVYPLGHVTQRDTLALVYIPGVLAVATLWGFGLAAVMSVASALAFNYFHVPRIGTLTFADSKDWAELAVFLVVALLASSMAQLARSWAIESVERYREADLTTGLARLILRTNDLHSVLPEASGRLRQALGLPFAMVDLQAVAGDERQTAFPLRFGALRGTLLVPAELPEPVQRRVRDRLVPALEALLQAARDREAVGRSLETSRYEQRVLVEEQTALRRVATLVARGVAPAEVFAAVAAEATRLLDADATRLLRYESPRSAVVLAEASKPGNPPLLGKSLVVDGGVLEILVHDAHPARVETYEDQPGTLADLARRLGFRSAVGAAIVVDGRVWGALVALWSRPAPPPADAEERLTQFTELAATAVANTECRAELNASRARIIMAADEARRRIERDLHDGVQQRLVSLGLQLRLAEDLVPGDLDEIKARLSRASDGLSTAFKDLQEISRGIHPAILSQGGLGPALKTLARRCPIPVTLNPGARRRLPACVEVAAYYAVSEALTNAVKHARATAIDIDIDLDGEALVLSIHDDGVGGADPVLGSGLVSLTDRVEALGGQLQVTSPAGGGTSVLVKLPTEADCSPQVDAAPSA
ncbi:hypothetical protein GCM10022255_008040 [Dactylosporangium darangshiense]|uniref:histidine kinase n=1 Tax=Dactylosporangium darangshiense TaxID=579108 RepID=A0ABP8CXG8_9ACTN